MFIGNYLVYYVSALLVVLLMDIIKDIPITYYKKTGHVDFDVLVFTKNYTNQTSKQYVGWQVLRGQSSVDFNFSAMIQVGASYKHQGQDIKCGPLNAEMGSIWEIIQETEDSTAVLRKGSNSSHLYDHQNPPYYHTHLLL